MERPPRITEPRVAYHLLNRRVMRLTIFEKDEDYAAFERVLAEGLDRPDAPKLLAYCLMPNHWRIADRLRLNITPRPRGRPRKRRDKSS